MSLNNPIDAVRKQVKKLGSLLPLPHRRKRTERQKAIVRPWREDAFHAYPSVGLTPSRVLSMLHAADAGSPRMQFELFGEMLQKWPRLAAVEATRRLALTGLDWELEPGEPIAGSSSTPRDAEAAVDHCRTALASIDRFRDVLNHLADAIGHGIAVAELVWESGSLADVVPVPNSRLISDVNEPWRLRVRTEEDPSVGVALDEHPAKWIVHRPHTIPGRAFEGGLLRASVLLYVAQNLSFKDWLIYSQIAGMPVRVGRFEPGTPEGDKQQLLKMLEALGTDAVAIISKNVELEMLEASRGDKPYLPLQDYCNTEVTILWLGQHLTTDLRGQGSRAAAEGSGIEPPRRQERQADAGFRVKGSGFGIQGSGHRAANVTALPMRPARVRTRSALPPAPRWPGPPAARRGAAASRVFAGGGGRTWAPPAAAGYRSSARPR